METEQPKFVQILSDGPDEPLYGLDEAGVVWRWELVVERASEYSAPTGHQMIWVPLSTERIACVSGSATS